MAPLIERSWGGGIDGPLPCAHCRSEVDLNDIAEERAIEVEGGFLCPMCSRDSKALVGESAFGYRIERLLDWGPVAASYRAVQLAHHREVDLQVVRITPNTPLNAVRRFIDQSKTVPRLDHPNIPALIEAGGKGGLYFIALARTEGEALFLRVARGGKLPVRAALEIAVRLADALRYLHAQGLVHRDVSPRNVRVDEQGRVKLTNFSFARSKDFFGDERRTDPGEIVGELMWCAPEQIKDPRTEDPRIDIYGLGACMYYMLAGRPPREVRSLADMADAAGRDPPPLSSRNPEVSPALEFLVESCMERDPESRADSAQVVLDGIEELLRGMGRT